MLSFTLACLKRSALAVTVLAAGSMLGCATSGPGRSAMAPVAAEYQYHCANGNKPVCTTYLGKQVECSCASRREFERLLSGY